MSGTKSSRKLDNPGFTGANNNPNNPGTTNPFATDAEIDSLQIQIDNITGGSGNIVISGNVSWSGSGLIYDVTTHVYVIQGTQYTSAATQVTLTSDPTNPQYWVVYADDTNSVGTIAGTPAPVPVPPSVDGLTQIVLATILVPAGATVPVITEITVYDENAGTPTEWAGTSDDTNVNFASTNDPFQGTVSIETNLPLGTNREIILTPASPYTIVNPSTLVFQMKAKVDMSATTGRLYIGFFNGGSLVGNAVYVAGTTLPIYGFDATDTSGYQIVSIPMAAFGVLPATVDALRFFKLSGSSTADFFLDDVHILEGGAVTPPTTVINFNDLGDVTLDFDTSLGVQNDDGKYPYYDETTQQFITSEEVNHGTVIINGKKSTAGTIAKGLPVYLVGEDNDIVTVELADANGAGTMPVIGFTAEPLNDTESKHIMTFGRLTGVNTTNAVTTLNPNGETWVINQALYISTTLGGLTNVRPTGASTAIQRVAKVLKVDATGGHLQIFNTFRTAGLPNLTNGNTWVGDANGYPIETPLPTGTVDGSGTLNYIPKWTPDGDTLGDSQIRDDGQTVGINSAPTTDYQLIVYNDVNDRYAIAGVGNANTTNFGITGVAANGTSNTALLGQATVGTGTSAIGLNVFANGLNGGLPTGNSIGGVIQQNQSVLGNTDGYGLILSSIGTSTGDNIGLYATANNAGAGSHWAAQFVDGTEGAGKVWTSDTQGRGTWQTPGGGGGGGWVFPFTDVSSGTAGQSAALVANGVGIGHYRNYAGTADDSWATMIPLYNNNVAYDGRTITIDLHWMLFGVPGVGDQVEWTIEYYFGRDGIDVFGATPTVTTTIVVVDARTSQLQYTDTVAAISGLAGDTQLHLRVRRNAGGANPNDTYPGAAELYSITFR